MIPRVQLSIHKTRTRMATIIAALIVSFIPRPAAAQSLQIPAKPHSGSTVITNVTIHPVSSDPIPRGWILFTDGLITDMGVGDYHPRPAPAGAANNRTSAPNSIDATGLHLYPGFVSADTTLGLTEIGAVRATIDTSEVGSITPEVRASVAVNPDSALIPVARANGILTALISPQGGAVSGYASLIRLDGWTNDELTIVDRAALVIRWPSTRPNISWWIDQSAEDQSRNARREFDRIDRAFRDAAAYLQARDADPVHPVDSRMEAFRPVLRGEKPVIIRASQAGQIRAAVAWADRLKIRIIIAGGRESGDCIDLLKSHDVPVILDGVHNFPVRDDSPYDEAFTLPARLHAAGIRFCIASGEDAAHERSLPYHAAMAAAYGLPRDDALRAVTLWPAQILGLGASHGSIEPGKTATFIVTTGDPLEITTDVLEAFIDGSVVDLGTKQKSLYEKYQERYRQMGRWPQP